MSGGRSHRRLLGAIAGATSLALASALAQDAGGDPRRGAIVAAQGTATVPSCAQCHAFNGASDGSGAFPRLTSQPAPYLARQMEDFASAARESAIMTPIAKQLSAKDRQDVAAYFAASAGPFPVLAGPDPVLVKAGEKLARFGDPARGIQGCNNCHGPDGAGFPPQIPYLAGQYADYLRLSLQMWKNGYRKNSPQAMAQVAQRLDDDEIEAVAAFYQQIRNPADQAAAQ